MNMFKMTDKTIKAAVRGKDYTKAVEAVKKLKLFAETNKWPRANNKNVVHDTIKMLVKNKIPKDAHQETLDTLLFQTRTLPKVNANRMALLKEIDKIIRQAEYDTCDHKIEIGVFMHGGGFCMPVGLPELICVKCGLNVTIGTAKPVNVMKNLGLKVSKKDLDQLQKWAKDCFMDRNIKVWSSSDITSDPIKALGNTAKWPHKCPFEIVDVDKLEKASGT